MNRVFKVIWNRTKGCYVVVAETAKNMTKRSSLSVVFSKMVGATALAVMLTGVMMPTDALGAPIINGIGAQASNNGGIAIGDITNALGDYSVAIGNGAKAAGESTVGTNIPTSTVAIGQGAQALENGDIVIGRSAKSIVSTHHGNPGSGAVVMGADAASYGARGDVAIGASAETNVKIKRMLRNF